MIKLRHLLIIIALLLLPISSSYAQENGDYFFHTIKKGENLHTIASMYNVSKNDIINLNPGSENVIYSGKTLMIPQKKVQQENDVFYTIKSGDTLYRLSVNYKISIDAIINANPGLSAQNFNAGQVIRIPQVSESDIKQEIVKRQEENSIPKVVKPRCREMHKVKRKETIYSVSRKYNISEDLLIKTNPELKNGMKKGMYLCIPNEEFTETEKIIENPYIVDNPPSDRDVFVEKELETATNKNKSKHLQAAIILPFSNENGRKADSYRMLEFYEGFLLAVDSLKQQGVSMDLYVYDSGETVNSVNQILKKPELAKSDIIFGPLYQEQINSIASYSAAHNIRLVIPFSSKTEVVFNNPKVYQINTPQSYLYNEVYQNFSNRFPNSNVVFVKSTSDDSSKKEFIDAFQVDLNTKGIKHQTINATDSPEQIISKLDYNKRNIFIPMSGKEIALNEMLPSINQVRELYPEVQFSVFGYPEWQTYTKDYIDTFFSLDTYFYSSFYTNNLLPGAMSFIKSYQKWYSKSMIDTYPKYGMLGFDISFFFLKGLSEYGNNLESHIKQVGVTSSIQTGFNFERVNTWGGFVNKKVFFVHFGRNYELSKIDFK